MELYTIAPDDLRRNVLIDGYVSLIWTERFIDPGDFNLVTKATHETVRLLRPGTLLGLSTSRELMLVDTRTIKGGLVTAAGKTVEAFFDNRRHDTVERLTEPGRLLGEIVENMQERKDAAYEIPRVRLGDRDMTGEPVYEKIKPGLVHESLLTVAKKYLIGMALYWTEREDGLGYDLAFSTRAAQDRTQPDSEGGQIIFSPDLDNFMEVSELLSNVDHKNTVVVYPPSSNASLADILEGVDPLIKPWSMSYEGFDKRMVEVKMSYITKQDQLDGATIEEKRDDLRRLMREKAKDALKDKKRVVDGEFAPAAQYVYYLEPNPEGLPEYRLGDIVSVRGNFTDPTRSLLSEYIHSADATGSRSYPGFVEYEEPEPEEEEDA